MNVANVLKGAMIRPGSDLVGDQTDTYNMGIVNTVPGRYYLVAFSILVKSPFLPPLLVVSETGGTSLTQIATTSIKTVVQFTPYQSITKTLGVFLYGGYCVDGSPTWTSTVHFGANYFSAFAFAVDEVSGTSSSPIIQSIALPNNTGSLASIVPGNLAYMAGTSLTPNGISRMQLSQGWTIITNSYDESLIPNLTTGYSLTDSSPGWSETNTVDAVDRVLIACELST